MPDKMRGFKMEPKGAYAKMVDSRGIPKYGLKKVSHLEGTEYAHTHKERPSHSNTPEAHNVPVKKMHSMKKMEEPISKMEDDAMKAMKDPVAKMKEPMAAMKDPIAKMDPIRKYKEAMPRMIDPTKKMRTGSLMRKDYTLQNKATEAEIQAAKQNAIDGGFDPEVANDVFAKYEAK